jgi:hypothetical protein
MLCSAQIVLSTPWLEHDMMPSITKPRHSFQTVLAGLVLVNVLTLGLMLVA